MPHKEGKNKTITWKRDFRTDVAGEALMHWNVVDRGGAHHAVFLPAHLRHHPVELRNRLANYMADLPTDGPSALAMIDAAIKTGPEEPHIGTLTKRTGWHLTSTPPTFVFRSGTVGDQSVVHHDLLAGTTPAACETGSLQAWRKGLKRPCRSSPHLVFALSLAFASPILRFYPHGTGLLFNLAGESGSGKTTLLKVAMSTMTAPTNREMVSANLSAAGLEQTSLELNDLILCLDEFGAALSTPKQAASLIHTLAYQTREGRGKTRSGVGQRSLGFDHATWSIAVLTSSENTLESMMGDEKRETGAQIRYVDLKVPCRADGGAFPIIKRKKSGRAISGADLVRKVEDTIGANYGLALPLLVERFISEPNLEAKLLSYRNEFVEILRSRSSGQQSRYLESFATVHTAGRLAVEYKIAPFSLKQLTSAVIGLFDQSELVSRGKTQMITGAITSIIRLGNDAARCPIRSKGQQIDNIDGSIIAVRIKSNPETLFIPKSRFGNLLPEGCRESAILNYLISEGVLQTRLTARTKQVLVPGLVLGNNRPSGYLIDWSKLQDLTYGQ